MNFRLIPNNKIKRMSLFYFNEKKKEIDQSNSKELFQKKEYIKKIKLKEPVKISFYDSFDPDDSFDPISLLKEKIQKLKIKDPVKKSSWDIE
jgi:hypothetical protein